jgi:glycylpeptide N-tetradecanoyltransferase
MLPADVPQAFRLLSDYLKKFALAPMFTLEEFQHFMTPRTDVVYSFVVEVYGYKSIDYSQIYRKKAIW